jgi:DNA-binding NtrC family response regulator
MKLHDKFSQETKVLIVDDEPTIADYIYSVLVNQEYKVMAFSEPHEALSSIENNTYDLALIDINMPVISGIELSRRILEISPETEIIIITGVPDENNLDPCLRMGLSQFLFKPFNDTQLIYTIYGALHHQRLLKAYKQQGPNTADLKSDLIGISESITSIRKEIGLISDTELPVLIQGDSGTGKEIIAADIHKNSSRRNKRYVIINCALLGNLADSELFGHSKGAFTGAIRSTKGYVGTADGGTLFLDEIGELPPAVQAKLLRFLDTGEYVRVGETMMKQSNLRIVAATNRNLRQMCDQNQFREDLYFRLSGSIIYTQALNHRREDILPLIWHFLTLFGKAQDNEYAISTEASSLLMEYDWKGNVRQLKQTLYKLTQVIPNRKILLSDVKTVVNEHYQIGTLTYKQAKEKVLYEFDKDYMLKVLSLSQGSLQKALHLSGMHKKNFYTKIKNLGLAVKDFSKKSTSIE